MCIRDSCECCEAGRPLGATACPSNERELLALAAFEVAEQEGSRGEFADAPIAGPERSAWMGEASRDRTVAAGSEEPTPCRDDIAGRALPRNLVEAARAEEL
eukprot:11918712-Alexandrium_andersonii.AAC.1